VRDPDALGPRGLDADLARSLMPAARMRRRWTGIAVAVEPLGAGEQAPPVHFRWDTDTEILSVEIADPREGGASSVSLELEGKDGAWITLELRAGRFAGIEIAVWPPVRLRSVLDPPGAPADAHVAVPAVLTLGGATDVEIDTLLAVEADRRRRTYHFRLGRPRPTRTVRVGRGILLDVDEAGVLAGLWLLHVPPQPIPH
jgi:hypothetical protein